MESLWLQEIRSRGLDQLYNTEEEMLQGKGELAAVEKIIQVSSRGLWVVARALCQA